MRPKIKGTVSCRDVHRLAVGWVQEFLRLPDHGWKCVASTVLSVLMFAAARRLSASAACARLRDAPGDQALRNALAAGLPEIDELERRLNRILALPVPERLKGRPRPLAIDLTLIPYYGRYHADPDEVVRNLSRNGTTHFHGYATCYVVHRNQRYTVALTRVTAGDHLADVLKRLLHATRRIGLKPRYLLLDRAFYSVRVIRYLQAARVPFLMPVVHRGRPPRNPDDDRSTRRFLRWKRSGLDRHTMVPGEGRRVTVDVHVVRCHQRRRSRRTGEWNRSTKTLVYASWRLPLRSPAAVRKAYGTRFGIETTYRQMNQCRIPTTTRQPLLRLLYVGLALILRNLWVWLHHEHLATPRRGGRRPNPHRLPLQTMLAYIDQTTANLLALVEATT